MNKLKILRRIFALIVLASVVAAFFEVIKTMLEMDEMAQSGSESFMYGLWVVIVMIYLFITVSAEVSLYFNCKYFIVSKSKNPLSTLFNMVLSLISLVIFSLVMILQFADVELNLYDMWLLRLFAALVAVRIIYYAVIKIEEIFLRRKEAAK